MWTLAPRLSHLNGGRWTVNGELNTIKETVEVRGNFTILNAQMAMSSLLDGSFARKMYERYAGSGTLENPMVQLV